jgi:hypothetical protein
LLAALAFVVLPAEHPAAQAPVTHDFEALPFAPRRAICYRTASPLSIDGRLDEPAWIAAPSLETFVDIRGGNRPAPRFATRAKMLWDDRALYVAADMEEPHLWSTLTTRDAVIFHDNDFEVFIDPDGDTHEYYELEANAHGTPWDLLLVRPYRDGGPPVNGWDIAGLQVGVNLRGTLNQPADRDEGWSIEIALPWSALRETAPGQRPPRAGVQWRVNFSRVEWPLDVRDGAYAKRLDPATSKPLAEDNWVWSPQGAIDMHMPERWGFVQFSDIVAGRGTDTFVEDRNERVKWALRRLYYRQRRFRADHGRFATDLASLDAGAITIDGLEFRPVLESTANLYEIRAPGFGGAVVHIRQDGRTWLTRAGAAGRTPDRP